jgi:hypothetical protein
MTATALPQDVWRLHTLPLSCYKNALQISFVAMSMEYPVMWVIWKKVSVLREKTGKSYLESLRIP